MPSELKRVVLGTSTAYTSGKSSFSRSNLHSFLAVGMNSIIVYVGHDLLGSFFPFAVYNQEKSHMTFLAANLVAVTLWLLISYYWFSLKFFVKIWSHDLVFLFCFSKSWLLPWQQQLKWRLGGWDHVVLNWEMWDHGVAIWVRRSEVLESLMSDEVGPSLGL